MGTAVLLLIALLGYISAERNYEITIKKVNCEYNADYYAYYHCKVRPVSRNLGLLSVNATLIKEQSTIWMRTQLFYKYTRYQPFIVDAFVDFCLFVKDEYNPISKILIGISRNYTKQQYHECPYKPGENILIKDLKVDTEEMPKIVPAGDYRLDVETFIDKNKTIRYRLTQLFVTVKALTLADLGMG